MAANGPGHEAQAALAALTAAMPCGLLVFAGPPARVVECNAAAERILRTPASALRGGGGLPPGWTLRDDRGAVLAPEEHPAHAALARGAAVAERVVGVDGPVAGETLWLRMSAAPAPWPAAAPPGGSAVLCVFEDVTLARRATAGIAGDAGFNAILLDNLPVQVTIYDPAARVVYVNATGQPDPAARRRMTGRTDAEHLPHQPGWLEVARRRAEAVARCVASGEVVVQEESEPGGGGRALTRIHLPMTGPDGTVQRVACYGIDTTQQRLAERARRETEARYRGLVERLPLITYVAALDHHRTPLFVNTQVERILGFTPEQWMEDPALWHGRIHPDDRPTVERALHELMTESGGRMHCEYRMAAADGGERWFGDEAVLVRGGEGQPPHLEGFLLDVTARHKAEEDIARLADVVDASQDAVMNLSAEGVILACNAAVETVYGHGRAELVGRPVSLVVDDEHLPIDREAMLRVAAGQARVVYDSLHRAADGAPVNVTVTLSPLRGPQGTVSGVAMIARDTTQRHSLENQLRQAQKMEAIGKLAGGIAHDFNNLLTAITGYTELALAELERDNPVRADLEEVARAAERASWLTRQLLAFSRRQVMVPEEVDLNTVVENMEKLMRRLIGEDIRLATSLAPDLGKVRVDPIQIEQVLMNLAVNARDAMPTGGDLRITTANAEMHAGLSSRFASVTPGPSVLLTVSDTGVGMDEETQARIFEPFFTTKETGKGTGLGLSTAYGIVKQSGGSIWVDSTPGHGCTFRIYLPRVDAAVAGPAVHPAAPETPLPGERILLVEDEEAVRQLAFMVLTRAGFHVESAADGTEALRMAANAAQPFTLLLTDVVMPGMSGREVAEALTVRQPGMKVLYMSGHADASLARHGVTGPGIAMLPKPFRPETLLARVRELLAE